jgi:hypothetical protein
MNQLRIYLYCFFFVLCCNSFSQKQKIQYENNYGLFFEICTDSSNLARYTEDNEVYLAGNMYVFQYQYITKDGEQSYYVYHNHNSSWEFCDTNLQLDSTIIFVKMEMKPDLGYFAKYLWYNQSVIEYEYLNSGKKPLPMLESTGLVENKKNIWMHPPRTDLFRILELNPFPFIQKPYKKGNKWKWKLQIGDGFSDKRWVVWRGTITNQYKYKITDTANVIHTELGDITCYVIESVAKSRIGKTYLTTYFNEIYGFVKLDYTNIDGSKIILELVKFEKK